MHLHVENQINVIQLGWEGEFAWSMKMDRRFMFMKQFRPQGVICPCPGAIYMYICL